jgi:hypothetical protein
VIPPRPIIFSNFSLLVGAPGFAISERVEKQPHRFRRKAGGRSLRAEKTTP